MNDPKHGFGADYFIAASDASQEGAYVPIYLTIILPYTLRLVKPLDRKTAAISLTKTLTDSERFAVRYVKGWKLTAETLVKLLVDPPVVERKEDVVVEADVDDLAFGVGFTALQTCKRHPTDLWPEISDIKAWVGQYYNAGGLPGIAGAPDAAVLQQWLNERMEPQLREAFVMSLK